MARTRVGRGGRPSERLWRRLKTPRCHMDLGRSTDKFLGGVLGERYQAIFQRRKRAGPHNLSRCHHVFYYDASRTDSGRLDSMEAQYYPGERVAQGPEPGDNVEPYLSDLCRQMDRRFIFYGVIGKGSFGYILAARDRTPGEDGVVKHYAVKVEGIKRLADTKRYYKAAVVRYVEVDGQETRYMPPEALVLQFTAESDRFPRIDSLYIHGKFTSIVMSADAVDQSRAREIAPSVGKEPIPVFRGHNGEQLMYKKKARLNEVQACKVASQLLEAMTYLMDMNMSHDDLSHRNYIVDKNLNIQLIDLESVHIAEKEQDFMIYYWEHIPAFEYMLAPEIVMLFTQHKYNSPKKDLLRFSFEYDHDVRVEHLWKFGVLVYDLLHGYSPWETPVYDPNIGEVKELYTMQWTDIRMRYIFDRRVRIMNEELPIDERLSQDCVDALRVLLAKEAGDRATLSELAALPWFQGHWADLPPEDFQRPLGHKKAEKSELTPSA